MKTEKFQLYPCPACGYPVIAAMHTCPQCNEAIKKAAEEERYCPHCQGVVQGDAAFCPYCGEMLEAAPPFAEEEKEPVYDEADIPECMLCPIPRKGEKEKNSLTYTGQEIYLARENTDPGNASIESEAQAALFYDHGEWFIEERSSVRSTYVHAGMGIKLHTGDIIRMGNREFEFKTKK